MNVDYDLVPEMEFDALCLELTGNDADAAASRVKYPAKLHARKVAAELGACDGLIYLPGQESKNYEDSDQPPAFRQRRYFYYMAGANFPGCVVTYEIAKDRLVLWVPYVEPRQVLWFGSSPSAAEAERMFDVDEVRYVDQLPKFMERHVDPDTTVYILHPDQGPALPTSTSTSPSMSMTMSMMAMAMASSTGGHHNKPRINSSRLRPAMDRARLTKTPYEVAMIRKANAVSSAAHRKVAEHILSLHNECDIEAIILASCTARGARSQSYPVIAGAGENGSTLHYGANDAPLKGQATVVLDAGCEWDCYASDITRTLPISGSFPPRAAAVHEIVQKMQDECIAAVEPGGVFYKLHLHAADVALEGLLKLGILRGDPKEIADAGTVSAFFPHGLGHHVGLEVHDVTGGLPLAMTETLRLEFGKRERVSAEALSAMRRMDLSAADNKDRQLLQPNMIVTVEPGIYFCRPYLEGYYLSDPKHACFINKSELEKYYDVGGVRIEDCILVTENGYENLTTAPKGNELIDVINGRGVSRKGV